MAEIFSKAGEELVINGLREAYITPFQAPNWKDLRIGFFLSATDDTGDDTITGLAETIAGVDLIGNGTLWSPPSDRYWIGIKDRSFATPREAGTVFMGYTNSHNGPITQGYELGQTKLSTSDIGIGTTNADYWRPNNDVDANLSAMISDGPQVRSVAQALQMHMVQDYTGGHAAGYATLLALRFTRDNAGGRARIITMSAKKTLAAYSTDILFNSTPTTAILQTNLETFPTTVGTLGPVELSSVPDALYLYWPFHLSRLRVHAIGIFKYA